MKIIPTTLCLCLVASSVQAASLAVGFRRTAGGNQSNSSLATAADYQANDGNFELTGTVIATTAGGNNGGTRFNALTTEGDGAGFDVTATGGGGGLFAASAAAQNNLSPISETYISLSDTFFTDGGNPVISIAGLAAFGADVAITLTTYAIGDNLNQDAVITHTFGTEVATGSTLFNGNTDANPVARDSAEGSVPFFQSTFTGDGVTDSISLAIGLSATDPEFTSFNGFSLSVVPVPEPSSTALFGLGAIALLVRRRRA